MLSPPPIVCAKINISRPRQLKQNAIQHEVAIGTPIPRGNSGAGDITVLAGRTLAYDSAGRLLQATHTPACPSGTNCLGPQTTVSHHNGHGQRFLRSTPQGQSVFVYGTDQYSVLSENHESANLSSSSTEHIYLPTASGPMPVIAIIDGQRFAVHADHLNTPRRLTDANNRPRWQWAYSAFGDLPAQSLPTAGLSTISYSLRYPGQVDDGNGLFYNFNRFYDPRVGRYTQADPIGLEGGWNRFGYVGGNPMKFVDPKGLLILPNNPSGLPSDWVRDPSHRNPNGERYRHPGGDILDWHPGTPGDPGFGGKDHWHHNGGKWHHLPGSEVPDPKSPPPTEYSPICNDNCKKVLRNTWDAARGLFIFTLVLICTTS
jgi:RHS repeat-associated protein